MNGLKNIDLIDCFIPTSFHGKIVHGFGYRCFYAAPNITRVFIPKTVTVFQGDTFVYCKKLEEIQFEDGFQNIYLGHYTLYGSGIKSFRFPLGSTIEYDFFSYSQIKNIYIYDMMSSMKQLFNSCPQDINIYVPVNYPLNTFGYRQVKKVLPFYSKQRSSCLAAVNYRIISFNNLIPFIIINLS